MTPAMLAIASGKGGVGKTVLAIALAQTLAARGDRILLADGDLGLANVDVQLGLQAKGDLMSVVSGGMTLAEAVLPFQGGAGAKGGFDILAGRSGSGALRNLPQSDVLLLGQSIRLLASQYRLAIIDLGAGIDETTISLCRLCGRVAVVLTDEPTSLTDAYALVKVLTQRAGAPSIQAIVNMAANTQDGRKSYESLAKACLRFLGAAPPLAGIVRSDPGVREAIKAQSSYLTRSPNGLAAQDIGRLGESLRHWPAVSPQATVIGSVR